MSNEREKRHQTSIADQRSKPIMYNILNRLRVCPASKKSPPHHRRRRMRKKNTKYYVSYIVPHNIMTYSTQ